MGSSRTAGARLLGFLTDASQRGGQEALRALNLERLAGRPIQEIFLGLTDYVCPEGGTVDEGIARNAFVETIADLAKAGVTDLNSLTMAQVQTVFELYATHTIEARLCNDIGMKLVTMPATPRVALRVQRQLRDFIRRGVADALARTGALPSALSPQAVFAFVGRVYRQAFDVLHAMGKQEAAHE